MQRILLSALLMSLCAVFLWRTAMLTASFGSPTVVVDSAEITIPMTTLPTARTHDNIQSHFSNTA